MDVLQALRFWHQNNETILAITAALFVSTLILLVIRSLQAKPGSEQISSGSLDLDAIESVFRKAIVSSNIAIGPSAQSNSASTAKPASNEKAGSEVSSAVMNELKTTLLESQKKAEELQKELEATQLELASRVAAGDAAAIAAADNKSVLQTGPDLSERVKELEAKLAEYQIIEDDIADLSHFKEENTNLRNELEELKKQGVGSAQVASASAPAAQGEDEIMKQFEKAVGVQQTPAAAAPATEQSNDLAKVAASLNTQQEIDALLSANNPQADAAPAPVNNMPAPAPVAEPVASEPQLDAEKAKIIAEAASLAASDVANSDSAMEEKMDPDKLIEEAAQMDGVELKDDLLSEFKDAGKGGAA